MYLWAVEVMSVKINNNLSLDSIVVAPQHSVMPSKMLIYANCDAVGK